MKIGNEIRWATNLSASPYMSNLKLKLKRTKNVVIQAYKNSVNVNTHIIVIGPAIKLHRPRWSSNKIVSAQVSLLF